MRIGCGGALLVVLLVIVIGIPALMRYIQRSMTVGPEVGVRKIMDGAVAYYHQEHVDDGGHVLPAQFPTATGERLAEGTCVLGVADTSEPPRGERGPITHDGSTGQAACWGGVGFDASEPTWFAYEVLADNSEVGAERLTVRGYADTDADGVLWVFERSLQVVDGVARMGQGEHVRRLD